MDTLNNKTFLFLSLYPLHRYIYCCATCERGRGATAMSSFEPHPHIQKGRRDKYLELHGDVAVGSLLAVAAHGIAPHIAAAFAARETIRIAQAVSCTTRRRIIAVVDDWRSDRDSIGLCGRSSHGGRLHVALVPWVVGFAERSRSANSVRRGGCGLVVVGLWRREPRLVVIGIVIIVLASFPDKEP